MRLILSAASLLLCQSILFAQTFIDPTYPGASKYDGWANLDKDHYPQVDYGYGTGYPYTAAWSSPIASNTSGSGTAVFNKVSGSGVPSDGFIYSALASPTNFSPSAVAGTFSITESSPLAGITTALFQIEIGYVPLIGSGFATGYTPTLTYNLVGGGSGSLIASSNLLYSGIFEDPTYGEYTADIWAFEWDFTSVIGEISSFDITFSTTNHAQIWEMQLNQGVVPEPSTWALIGFGAILLLGRNLRRRKAS